MDLVGQPDADLMNLIAIGLATVELPAVDLVDFIIVNLVDRVAVGFDQSGCSPMPLAYLRVSDLQFWASFFSATSTHLDRIWNTVIG